LKNIIDRYFLFDEDMTKVEDGIYAGMMNGLGDPYTVYYTKEEYKALNEDTEGKYSGIGAMVSQNPNTKIITIVKIFDNSPANDAGLQVGDIIYKIDGEEVAGTDMDILVKTKIRGEEGTSFKMTVLRGDDRKEVELDLTRRSIEVETVAGKMLDNNIGYIAVSQFDAVTSEQFKSNIESLQSQGMKKLIVDLRGNPGGLLDQVVDMLDYILPEGLVLYTEDKYGEREEYYSDGSHELKIPMVVLVNENSASASMPPCRGCAASIPTNTPASACVFTAWRQTNGRAAYRRAKARHGRGRKRAISPFPPCCPPTARCSKPCPCQPIWHLPPTTRFAAKTAWAHTASCRMRRPCRRRRIFYCPSAHCKPPVGRRRPKACG